MGHARRHEKPPRFGALGASGGSQDPRFSYEHLFFGVPFGGRHLGSHVHQPFLGGGGGWGRAPIECHSYVGNRNLHPFGLVSLSLLKSETLKSPSTYDVQKMGYVRNQPLDSSLRSSGLRVDVIGQHQGLDEGAVPVALEALGQEVP